jgi:hypothetical protein
MINILILKKIIMINLFISGSDYGNSRDGSCKLKYKN